MRVLFLWVLTIFSAFSQAVVLPKPAADLPKIMKEWAAAQKGMADMQVAFQQWLIFLQEN